MNVNNSLSHSSASHEGSQPEEKRVTGKRKRSQDESAVTQVAKKVRTELTFESLEQCITSGNVRQLTTWIKDGLDVNKAYNESHDTLLHLAARIGQLKVVKFLLCYGADKVAINKSIKTPLKEAVEAGHLDVVKHLVEKYANIGKQGEYTPLHIAASNGNIEIAKFLIQKGAGVELWDLDGMTPLFAAIEFDQLEMVQFLLDQGANIEHVSSEETTPLGYAIEVGKYEVVKILLERGASLEKEAGSYFSQVLEKETLEQGDIDILNELFAKGVEISYEELEKARTKGWIECLPDELLEKRISGGRSLLLLAASQCSLPVIQALLERGANISSVDKDRNTFFHFFIFNKNFTDIVKYLNSKQKVDWFEVLIKVNQSGQNPFSLLVTVRKPEELNIIFQSCDSWEIDLVNKMVVAMIDLMFGNLSKITEVLTNDLRGILREKDRQKTKSMLRIYYLVNLKLNHLLGVAVEEEIKEHLIQVLKETDQMLWNYLPNYENFHVHCDNFAMPTDDPEDVKIEDLLVVFDELQAVEIKNFEGDDKEKIKEGLLKFCERHLSQADDPNIPGDTAEFWVKTTRLTKYVVAELKKITKEQVIDLGSDEDYVKVYEILRAFVRGSNECAIRYLELAEQYYRILCLKEEKIKVQDIEKVKKKIQLEAKKLGVGLLEGMHSNVHFKNIYRTLLGQNLGVLSGTGIQDLNILSIQVLFNINLERRSFLDDDTFNQAVLHHAHLQALYKYSLFYTPELLVSALRESVQEIPIPTLTNLLNNVGDEPSPLTIKNFDDVIENNALPILSDYGVAQVLKAAEVLV